MTLIQRIRQLPAGTVIPKPAAREKFIVKGWGKRRGEAALIYFIPNHSDPSKPHQKGITESEWNLAIDQLMEGELTKAWFTQSLVGCAKEGDCNFTTIGGIFCLLGAASREGRGVYRIK